MNAQRECDRGRACARGRRLAQLAAERVRARMEAILFGMLLVADILLGGARVMLTRGASRVWTSVVIMASMRKGRF